MPNRTDILANLQLIANRVEVVASLWHILAFFAFVAFAAGWRPARKTVALLLLPLVLSVAVIAWIHRNPFNGISFTLLALVLGLLARRVAAVATRRPSRGELWLGIAMIAFGFAYPHFLTTRSAFWYLYSAPLGLLPCPTLSFVIGVTLVAGGLGVRAWSLVLAVAGLAYGLFGVARLGVWLDLGLILGAAGLLLVGLRKQEAE